MAISEELVLKDNVSAAAESAAAACENLAAAQREATEAAAALSRAESKADKLMGDPGAWQEAAAAVEQYASASAAAEGKVTGAGRAVNKANLNAEKAAAALKKFAAAEEEAANAAKHLSDAEKDTADESKHVAQATGNAGLGKSLKQSNKALGIFRGNAGDSVEALEGMSASGAAAIGVIAAVAGVAILAYKGFSLMASGAYDLSKAAGQAFLHSGDLERSLDQLTKGHGSEALRALAQEAKGLGIPLDKAVEQFTDFRKQGIDNSNSQALIRLQADLEAVGVSGENVSKAMGEAVKQIKGGKDAGAVIKDVAQQFGAMGDGSNAAAQNLTGLQGAINRIQGAWDSFAGALAGKVDFDAIGDSISSLFDEMGSSNTATSLIDTLAGALDSLPAIIENVKAGFAAFDEAAGPGLADLAEGINDLTSALGSTTDGTDSAVTAGSALGAVFGTVAGVFGMFASIAGAVVGAFGSIGDACSAVGDAFSAAGGVISDFFSGMADGVAEGAAQAAAIGSAILDGLISALDPAAFIEALTGVVQGGIDAAKSLLGISSPSKVFAEIGAQTGAGMTRGLDNSMVAVQSAMSAMVAPPANTNASPAASSIAPVINITVNAGGGDAHAIGAEVRRQVEAALRMGGLA